MVSLERLRASTALPRAGKLRGLSCSQAGGTAGTRRGARLGASSRGRLSGEDSPWRQGFQLIFSELLSNELAEAVTVTAKPGEY